MPNWICYRPHHRFHGRALPQARLACLLLAMAITALLTPTAIAGNPAHASTEQPRQATTTDRLLSDWRFVRGKWSTVGSVLSGEIDATTRAFAVADDSAFAPTQALDVRVTPRRNVGNDWSAAGVCLWLTGDNYWRLSLAESPDGKARYAELTLMREGQGVADAALKALERDEKPLAWQWNTAYRLRLTLSNDRIVGEVYAEAGDGKRAPLWHVVYALEDVTLVRFGRLAVGVQGMRADFARAQQAIPHNPPPPIPCESLAQKNTRSLWLSLPGSRLVINPTMVSAAAVPPTVAPSLPVNLAYYFGETPLRLPGFWAWYTRPLSSARDLLTRGPSADFARDAARTWSPARARAEFADGQARVTVSETPYGSIETDANVDIDRTPYLIVRVPHAEGGWALKVNGGRDPVDTYIQHDTQQTGSFVYDLRTLTKWRGRRAFRIILFALGAKGNTTTFSDLRFAGNTGSLPQIEAKSTTWYPHQVTAQSEGDGLKIDSATCLADESTIAQRLRVLHGASDVLVLTGQLPPGAAADWDDSRHTLDIAGAGYRVVLAVSRAARWEGAFASGVDMLSGNRPPPIRGSARGAGGTWALTMDRLHTGDEIVVAARFAPMPADSEDLRAGVMILVSGGFDAALRKQAGNWEARLAAVPHPLTFAISSLDAMGATPDAVMRAYYRAWVFLFSDELPPQPENGYDYPQMACGKPSLWAEGAPHALPTSQWESVLAMQYLALASPETAWRAYEGLLSLVDARGVLAGEGLPTRFAQTAWILYAQTEDRARLAKVYPALKRLLLWKAADPRWLYKGSTPPDQKDAEFVVHALMDMLFAERIATALEMPDEIDFWKAQRAKLAAGFHQWFWDENGGSYRTYRAATGKREGVSGTWNLQGLVLPPSLLLQTERDRLLALFRANLKRDMVFLVPALSGFPKFNFTLQGVWQYGAPDEAETMADSALREVTNAGEFSENYSQDRPPAAVGVMPSMFGALQIIDGALWRSGVRLSGGLPRPALLPHTLGLWNLRVRGDNVSLVVDRRSGLVEMQGEGLKRLTLPDGFRSLPLPDGTPRWQGEMAGLKP